MSDTVHQFAPAYHDYVLYSDGGTKPVPPKTGGEVWCGEERALCAGLLCACLLSCWFIPQHVMNSGACGTNSCVAQTVVWAWAAESLRLILMILMIGHWQGQDESCCSGCTELKGHLRLPRDESCSFPCSFFPTPRSPHVGATEEALNGAHGTLSSP